MRLHIDGDLITEAHLCSLSNEPDHQDGANLISLVGSDDKLEGYVYNVVVVHTLGTIQEQCVKVIILATIMAFLLVFLCEEAHLMICSLNCRTHHLSYLLTFRAVRESKRVIMAFGSLWVVR
jgi:hypothetical protein